MCLWFGVTNCFQSVARVSSHTRSVPALEVIESDQDDDAPGTSKTTGDFWLFLSSFAIIISFVGQHIPAPQGSIACNLFYNQFHIFDCHLAKSSMGAQVRSDRSFCHKTSVSLSVLSVSHYLNATRLHRSQSLLIAIATFFVPFYCWKFARCSTIHVCSLRRPLCIRRS